MRKNSLNQLTEKEKILYLEVEQLRSRLYLHNESPLFEFFALFYFSAKDIKKLFIKKKSGSSIDEIKRKSIESLIAKKNWLLFLNKTPYAWIIFIVRKIKIAIISFLTKRNGIYTSEKEPFLVLGTTNAHDFQSRSVQIARKIAEKNKVIYIEGVFDEGKKGGLRIIEDSGQFVAVRLTTHESLHLNYQQPSPRDIILLNQSLKLFSDDFRLNHFKIYVHHPFWNFVLHLKKNTFLFDHADDFTQVHNAAEHIILAEKLLLKNAHFVTAPHSKLFRKKGNILIENGVDWAYFKDTAKMIQTCDVGLCWIKKPVLGFIGTLDEKIDEVLVGKLARAFPTASIVLVGNTDYRPTIEVAEQYQNIFPVGKQSYKKLPLFLQSFDILITPYKSFPQGIVNHPELPLYLASGKPIVATHGTVTGSLKRCIYLPTSHIDWVDAVSKALKEKKHTEKRHLRIAAAKKLKWKIPKLLY